jgi:GDP-L-fucose synthase
MEVVRWLCGELETREFMHVDDCAAAIIFYLENYNQNDFINVGVGEDISIKALWNLLLRK